MKKILALLNSISVLFVIGINYVSQAMRFNNTTVGELSNKYDNLFTPASYAFAIWILIFSGLIAYSIYQIRNAFFKPEKADHILQTGYWFLIANVLTGCWVLVFTYEYFGISVLIMLGIVFSLSRIVIKTKMERWDASLGIIVFVWWPICLFIGWISVATIANLAIYLTKINWSGFGLNDITWTIIMVIVAVLLNLFMVVKRNMREFALVGAWALIAIYVRHNGDYNSIAYTALIGAIILVLSAGVHGFLNRTTNPGKKLMERFRS
ncbi:tryptophan-rich sensory protein [uncultured Aquimarina sp.]|uniref:tryptophan-rich sensory protein n=1 Tax=uncultured Aquimarina sp. TaxID=575652 RepID=UPI002611F17F|nr:tryptophan-rich sensory protein [uncultured Aquimarina sp.]